MITCSLTNVSLDADEVMMLAFVAVKEQNVKIITPFFKGKLHHSNMISPIVDDRNKLASSIVNSVLGVAADKYSTTELVSFARPNSPEVLRIKAIDESTWELRLMAVSEVAFDELMNSKLYMGGVQSSPDTEYEYLEYAHREAIEEASKKHTGEMLQRVLESINKSCTIGWQSSELVFNPHDVTIGSSRSGVLRQRVTRIISYMSHYLQYLELNGIKLTPYSIAHNCMHDGLQHLHIAQKMLHARIMNTELKFGSMRVIDGQYYVYTTFDNLTKRLENLRPESRAKITEHLCTVARDSMKHGLPMTHVIVDSMNDQRLYTKYMDILGQIEFPLYIEY